ncbi:unnamed protein product [Toxocara canis]|uniref:DUF7153 domain-containing protein n=1 Tax=Toxocara canis TaxID=6265 RepID=A0A183V6X7_TOXCA|nr:unnamed protein product [Toxocara canis]
MVAFKIVVIRGNFRSEFPAEDSSLDFAISQTHLIRSHPLFAEGVLLRCVDAKPLFPYLHYSFFKGSDHELRIANIEEVIREINVRADMVKKISIRAKCQFGAYDEMYSIQKTTPTPDARLPSHRHAGYIVISFKILEEQTQQESLEKSWLSWSGAREIYKYSPRSWNLRRISLYKIPKRRIRSSSSLAYVMMCEFGSIMHPSNHLQALDMCERLRVRNCGYVSLYQIMQWSYSNTATSLEAPAPSPRKERNPMLKGLSQEVTFQNFTKISTTTAPEIFIHCRL